MKTDPDADLAKEIRAHLDLDAEERMANGLSSADAHRAARRAFGSVLRVQEDARTLWTWIWLEQSVQDVQYAVRPLCKQPGFTAVMILTLALGIGATTAIFSVVHGVLFRPLPFKDPDRLVRIVEHIPASESFRGVAMRMAAMNQGEFDWWRTRTTTLPQMAVTMPQAYTLIRRDSNVRLTGARVSPALFPMRGVAPVLGRGLYADEDRPSRANVVVLSVHTWQRYFGADPDVINRTIVLDDQPFTVVGVIPEAFGDEALWTPYVIESPRDGTVTFLNVMARLGEGVSIEAAAAEVNALGRQLRSVSTGPATPPRFEIVREQDEMVARLKPALRVLVAAVAVVLLIVCANVANLLLTRGARRQQEIGLRCALGATRGRIVRQVLTESLVLAASGAIAGVALAYGGVALLKGLSVVELPAGFGQALGSTLLPRIKDITIDPAVLAFAFGTALVASVLFGSAPACRLAAVAHRAAGGPGTESRTSGHSRTGYVLAAVQLGLATTLLVGAALLLVSFVKLASVPLGFDPQHVLSFDLVLPQHYLAERKLTVAEDLATALRSLPQVTAAGFTDRPPLSNRINPVGLALPARTPSGPDHEDRRPETRYVSPDYLRALGVRLVEGRWLEARDRTARPAAVLVSRAYARYYFDAGSPVGVVLQTPIVAGHDQGQEIVVGVVDDVRLSGMDSPPPLAGFVDPRRAFIAYLEWMAARGQQVSPDGGSRLFLTGITGTIAFAVRVTGDPLAIAPDVRRLIGRVDPSAAIDSVMPMERVIAGTIAQPRFYAVLVGIFGTIAATLAAIGIYGVLAYAVAQRTKEIGIRLALGATRAQTLRLIMRQGVVLVAAGITAGLAGALGLTRSLSGMLFGLTAVDAPTYAGVAVGFAAIALLASYVPARRATRVDPLVALRHD